MLWMMMTMSAHDSSAAVILNGHGPWVNANGLHASVDSVIAASSEIFYVDSRPFEAILCEDYGYPYVEGCGYPYVEGCPCDGVGHGYPYVEGCDCVVWGGFCLGGICHGPLGDFCVSGGYGHVVSGPWVECRALLVGTGAARGGPQIGLQACSHLFPHCAWHQAPFEPPLESRSPHTRIHGGDSIAGPSLSPRA